jgi:hypothetical protein
MLSGDVRRQLLGYSLIFTIPGTPVLWYGEEIGMGDDLRQEERNSVRTPMQWTAEPNAGFADPSVKKLRRPVIDSGKFDYRRVNVQAQRRDPGASSTRTDSRAACANAAGSRSGFAAALGHTAGHRLGNRTGCFGISQYHNPTARAGVLDRARNARHRIAKGAALGTLKRFVYDAGPAQPAQSGTAYVKKRITLLKEYLSKSGRRPNIRGTSK